MRYYLCDESPMDRFLKTPDGALLRYRHFKPLTRADIKPNILICPGRATAVEKFENVIENLRDRGYNVWVMDWRGQGLSTREAGRKGYISSYHVYLNDLNLFIRTFLKTDRSTRPLVVLGQSMGGHLALRSLVTHPGLIDAAILTAPMLDIHTGLYSKKLAAGLSNLMVWLGLGKSYIYKQGDYNPVNQPFEGNILTHNQELFYYHRHLQITNPDIVVGGVTFGWIKATLDSIEALNKKSVLKKINVPIQIYAADEEQVVDNQSLAFFEEHIAQCRIEILKGTRHQLLAERPEVLEHIYNGIDRFIAQKFTLPVYDLPLPHTQTPIIAKPSKKQNLVNINPILV